MQRGKSLCYVCRIAAFVLCHSRLGYCYVCDFFFCFFFFFTINVDKLLSANVCNQYLYMRGIGTSSLQPTPMGNKIRSFFSHTFCLTDFTADIIYRGEACVK